jgi:hypothetical protein
MNTILSIAHTVVLNRSTAIASSSNTLIGPQPLVINESTSAGDPASLGVSVLLASWTGMWARDGLDYAGAAQGQFDFLLEEVPRTEDGAISHLVDEVQLWVRACFCLLLLFFFLVMLSC